MSQTNKYEERGVSTDKGDVHNVVSKMYPGIFPGAFCKALSDIAGDPKYYTIDHADGAGTKSALAYIYWRETGDLSVFEGVAIDSIVMNLDDLLCMGITNEPIRYVSQINRNKHLIPGEVLDAIIGGTERFIQKMNSLGLNITFSGGETADLGDVVRTVTIDGMMTTRMKRDDAIIPSIISGDVIVGISSTGQTTYEDTPNSGMGSNGLTSARHDMLKAKYKRLYPESYDPNTADEVIYSGSYELSDPITFDNSDITTDMGKFILSPTRTYAPIMAEILKKCHRMDIHAIIHCSGGGQTKVSRFLNENVRVIKDNMFPVPKLFGLMQKESGTSWKDMYKITNMGHRMELYVPETVAKRIIPIVKSFGIEAKIIGRCAHRLSVEPAITIFHENEKYEY